MILLTDASSCVLVGKCTPDRRVKMTWHYRCARTLLLSLGSFHVRYVHVQAVVFCCWEVVPTKREILLHMPCKVSRRSCTATICSSRRKGLFYGIFSSSVGCDSGLPTCPPSLTRYYTELVVTPTSGCRTACAWIHSSTHQHWTRTSRFMKSVAVHANKMNSAAAGIVTKLKTMTGRYIIIIIIIAVF